MFTHLFIYLLTYLQRRGYDECTPNLQLFSFRTDYEAHGWWLSVDHISRRSRSFVSGKAVAFSTRKANPRKPYTRSLLLKPIYAFSSVDKYIKPLKIPVRNCTLQCRRRAGWKCDGFVINIRHVSFVCSGSNPGGSVPHSTPPAAPLGSKLLAGRLRKGSITQSTWWTERYTLASVRMSLSFSRSWNRTDTRVSARTRAHLRVVWTDGPWLYGPSPKCVGERRRLVESRASLQLVVGPRCARFSVRVHCKTQDWKTTDQEISVGRNVGGTLRELCQTETQRCC